MILNSGRKQTKNNPTIITPNKTANQWNDLVASVTIDQDSREKHRIATRFLSRSVEFFSFSLPKDFFLLLIFP